MKNEDCNEGSESTACCSEGFCTHDVVCQGNKVNGDYCDKDSECLTRHCNMKINECSVNETGLKSLSILVKITSILAALVVLIMIVYCCNICLSQSK